MFQVEYIVFKKVLKVHHLINFLRIIVHVKSIDMIKSKNKHGDCCTHPSVAPSERVLVAPFKKAHNIRYDT